MKESCGSPVGKCEQVGHPIGGGRLVDRAPEEALSLKMLISAYKKIVNTSVPGPFNPLLEHRDGWCQLESENCAMKKNRRQSSAPFVSTAALETAPINKDVSGCTSHRID